MSVPKDLFISSNEIEFPLELACMGMILLLNRFCVDTVTLPIILDSPMRGMSPSPGEDVLAFTKYLKSTIVKPPENWLELHGDSLESWQVYNENILVQTVREQQQRPKIITKE